MFRVQDKGPFYNVGSHVGTSILKIIKQYSDWHNLLAT